MSYDAKEAARLISWSNKQAGIAPLSEEELIRWIDEGVGTLAWADIWEEDGEIEKYIDFPTLISLRMVCLLNSHGVSFEKITEFASLSRETLGLTWPLASRSLWNPPSSETPNVLTLDGTLTDPILDAISRYFVGNGRSLTDLEFDKDGIACSWTPIEGISIDPRFVSGSPCLARTRIPTWVFPGMRAGGDRIQELAADYCTTVERVELALEWERQLADLAV